MPTVRVDLAERSYDVIVQPGALGQAGNFISQAEMGGLRAAVISDETVAGFHSAVLLDSLTEAGFRPTLHTVPAGEASKSLRHLETLSREMIRAGHDRKSMVVALGGGVVGDLAGWTLEQFQVFKEKSIHILLWRTLWISSLTTAICLILALPVAWFLARMSPV